MPNKRIVNISYSDFGGAGLASRRSHEFLLAAGYSSYLILNQSKIQGLQNSVVLQKRKETFRDRFRAFIEKIPTKRWTDIVRRFIKVDLINPMNFYCFFSVKEKKDLDISEILSFLQDDDIVILYWVGNFVNSANILEIFRQKKIKLFWYALDMAAVTGGCHFSWSCNGYQQFCLDCPALPYDEKLFAYQQLEIKKSNLAKCEISLITASSYGINKFQPGSLRFDNYYKLPYAINTDIFKPVENNEATQRNSFRIFFNAFNKNDYRKGWTQFKDAIYHLDKLLADSPVNTSVELISVDSNGHRELETVHITLHSVAGVKTTEEGLADLYRLADVMVCTSIEDLCPLMINEALLCGVPVVAFDIAANSEYVHHGSNGIIIKSFDVKEMARAIHDIISGKKIFDTKQQIRESVFALHNLKDWSINFDKIINA